MHPCKDICEFTNFTKVTSNLVQIKILLYKKLRIYIYNIIKIKFVTKLIDVIFSTLTLEFSRQTVLESFNPLWWFQQLATYKFE